MGVRHLMANKNHTMPRKKMCTLEWTNEHRHVQEEKSTGGFQPIEFIFETLPTAVIPDLGEACWRKKHICCLGQALLMRIISICSGSSLIPHIPTFTYNWKRKCTAYRRLEIWNKTNQLHPIAMFRTGNQHNISTFQSELLSFLGVFSLV